MERVYTRVTNKGATAPKASLKNMAKTRIATLTPIAALLLREVFNEYIESKQKLLKHKNLAPITRQFIQERIDNITELKIKIFKQ